MKIEKIGDLGISVDILGDNVVSNYQLGIALKTFKDKINEIIDFINSHPPIKGVE